MLKLMLTVALAAAPVSLAPPTAPAVQQVAPHVFLQRGGSYPGRGPDGNTVIFSAPDGLVVIDTGRHTWHSDAILAFAAARRQPIRAIINTHWHLDHSSGDRRLKAAFPDARLYASTAIERALTGFLARSAEDSRAGLARGELTGVREEEAKLFLDTMDHAASLRPDIAITRSRRMRLAGHVFDIRLAARAATDADVWLFDPESRVAVVGDLVTLPGPYFDTACPAGWKAALADIWDSPFRQVVPGHGKALTRAEFATYRSAFNNYIDCAASDAEPAACGVAWSRAVDSLMGDDRSMRERAPLVAESYVRFLRRNGGSSPDCADRPRA